MARFLRNHDGTIPENPDGKISDPDGTMPENRDGTIPEAEANEAEEEETSRRRRSSLNFDESFCEKQLLTGSRHHAGFCTGAQYSGFTYERAINSKYIFTGYNMHAWCEQLFRV